MREIELKLLLDPRQETRLRAAARKTSAALGRARTRPLESRYFDTADGALQAAGIALRLRRDGRRWIQTVKQRKSVMEQGLSTPEEIEIEVSGDALEVSLIADHDLRETLIGLARKGLDVIARTSFRRTSRLLRAPGGSTVEMAIDKGVLGVGDRMAPFIEVEFELLDGKAHDLYALAGALIEAGPARFAEYSKLERAIALGQGGDLQVAAPLRKARPLHLVPDMTVEDAARAIMGEYLGHALPNIARLIDHDDPGGPHQLRVGLRRLRSAFSALRPALGSACLVPWSDQARSIAAEAGRLRDLDVLDSDLVAPFAEATPEEPGFAILADAIRARRDAVRAEVRDALAAPDVTGFGFAMAGFLAARGWLDPADHGQTRRLAEPVLPFARRALQKRWKALAAYGRRIDTLDIEARHEMRKELKKLRYVMDAFKSLYAEDRVADFLKRIKRLQTAFGALNDSAMAETLLLAEDAPGAGDPAAQRAAGRVIGRLLAESDRLWPQAIADWQALAQTAPFWKPERSKPRKG